MNRENLDRNLSSLFGSSLHWLFAELHSQKKLVYSNSKEGQLQYVRPFIHILESRRETENCLNLFFISAKRGTSRDLEEPHSGGAAEIRSSDATSDSETRVSLQTANRKGSSHFSRTRQPC